MATNKRSTFPVIGQETRLTKTETITLETVGKLLAPYPETEIDRLIHDLVDIAHRKPYGTLTTIRRITSDIQLNRLRH
jgi:hypothetical protein